MNKQFLILLLLALAAYGQHEKVDNGKSFTDDRDGKKYKAVVIGEQTWMAENLNYDAIGSRCYGNKPLNCYEYGRLYNWATAKTICPKGWHLPSKSEWEVLTASIGGDETEGKYLKAANGWNDNGNGEDEFGFSALPGGYGYPNGKFESTGNYGYWWSNSENDDGDASSRNMSYDSDDAYWDYYSKSFLCSVRCLQN